MRFVKIEGYNADFGRPPDWNETTMGPCGSLPVRKEVIGQPGRGAYMSLKSNWLPSAAELAVLNAGGVVELECCGSQPAVSLSVVPCADLDVLRSRAAAAEPKHEYHDRNNPSNVG